MIITTLCKCFCCQTDMQQLRQWTERFNLTNHSVFAIGVMMLSCFSRVQLFATLWTIARQALLSTGFSRHEYWSGLPCPPPGDLPNPGTEPTSYISFIGRQVLVTSAIWEAPMMVSVSTKNKQTNKKNHQLANKQWSGTPTPFSKLWTWDSSYYTVLSLCQHP